MLLLLFTDINYEVIDKLVRRGGKIYEEMSYHFKVGSDRGPDLVHSLSDKMRR